MAVSVFVSHDGAVTAPPSSLLQTAVVVVVAEPPPSAQGRHEEALSRPPSSPENRSSDDDEDTENNRRLLPRLVLLMRPLDDDLMQAFSAILQAISAAPSSNLAAKASLESDSEGFRRSPSRPWSPPRRRSSRSILLLQLNHTALRTTCR